MKKLLLFFLVALFCQTIYSQTPPTNSLKTLPTISPASPESASLGKYGEVPVNLSTGKINYSIPIYTIKAGGQNFPISLSYNYGGFMPEEAPSMVGIGWTMFSGGAITRKLNGLPDELGGIGYLDMISTIKNYNNLSPSQASTLIKNSGDRSHDTEPDEFIISAGTISGSFYFGENSIPVFKINKNYKVEILPRAHNAPFSGFIITDTQGVKYRFDAIEEGQYKGFETGDELTVTYNSSWKLTKISFAHNTDQITFEYVTGNVNSVVKTKTKIVKTVLSQDCNDGETTETSNYTNTVLNLKKINFPNGYINFVNTTPFFNAPIKLDNLQIFNINNKLINKISFNYYNSNKYYRFLTSLEKGNLTEVESKYSFEYYDLNSIPQVKSYDSDLWGFYTNSQDHFTNFNMSRYGALKKIIYPTKGFTEIEYEQNQIKTNGNGSGNSNVCDFNSNQTKTLDNLTSQSIERTLTDNVVIDKYQVIKVTLTAFITDAEQEVDVSFKANTPATPLLASHSCPNAELLYPQNNFHLGINGEEEFEGNNVNGELFKTVSKYLYVAPGTYNLSSYVLNTSNKNARGKIVIQYNKNTSGNSLVGGIRISKTKDCANNGSACIERGYNYINQDGSSSGVSTATPKFFSMQRETIKPSGNCKVNIYSYRSVIPITSYQGSHVLYKRVETFNAGSGINNGKKIQFFTGTTSTNVSPYSPKDFKDWSKGLLEKELIYKFTGGQYVLQKKTENTFEEIDSNDSSLLPKTNGIRVVRNHYAYSQGWSGGPITETYFNDAREYKLDFFFLRSHLYHLKKTTETLYFENNSMINIKDYVYNIPYGRLTEVQTTDSKGEVLKTKTYYPDDVTSVSSLGNGNLTIVEYNAIDKLKKSNLHLTRVPIQVKNYKNNVLKSTQYTQYKDWGNNIVLPQEIKASKETGPLKDKLVFHSYYTNGNVKEVSKKDGTHIVYIWGYNQTLPIAKIENATYSGVSSYVSNLHNKSNADNDRTLNVLGNEGALRDALETMRTGLLTALPNAQVTTFTYDPLIGVTSITDPRGRTNYYHYDAFNRLQYVKDHNGNVLSENQYNYKN